MNRSVLLVFVFLVASSVFLFLTWGTRSNLAPTPSSQVTVSPSATPTPIPAPLKTTFTLGGDLMFDRYVYHQFKNRGLETIFEHLDPNPFEGVDLALANLEGPISAQAINDDYTPDNLVFNFPPETVKTLQYLKLNAVSLANNHTLNAGAAGLAMTQKLLGEAKISAIGQQNKFDDSSIGRFETQIPISVIAINLLESSVSGAEEAIKREKGTGRFVIVFPHWGGEYQRTHSSSQQLLAHHWIESGADMVCGSHPHVVQDLEIYQDKPIIYSLGNFVFDQTFSKETQEGLLVTGVVGEKSLELTFFPTKPVSLQPELMEGEQREKFLAALLSDIPKAIQSGSDRIKLPR